MTVSIYKLELSKEEIIRELCDVSQRKNTLAATYLEDVLVTLASTLFGITLKSEELNEIWELINSVEMKPLIEKMECALRRCKEEDLRKMYDGENPSASATEIMNQFCIEAAEWVTDNSLVLGIENCD